MKKILLPLTSLSIFFISFFYLLEMNRYKLSDTAIFPGDSATYQSLGVNLSLGYGYKYGCVEKFEIYKFNKLDSIEKTKDKYDEYVRGGRRSFYRTPGYPLFLAAIYKVFGIHPRIVKIIQIILLAISISLLPAIGNYYWSRSGILAGALSSLLSVRYLMPDPCRIMTEPLIIFSLFVLTVFLISWEARQSVTRTLFLGMISGIIILVKGSNIFIPAFLLLYIIFKIDKPKEKLKSSSIFIIGLLLFVLPWSIYASKKTSKFVVLSKDQPTQLLLDSNNEDSLKTGGFAPAWRMKKKDDPKYLYNRLRNSDYTNEQKFLIFMRQNKKSIPILLRKKLLKTFLNKKVFFVVAGMFLYYFMSALAIKCKVSIDEKIPVFPLLYFANIFLITLIYCGHPRFVLPFMPFFILPAVYLLLKIPDMLMSHRRV